MSGAWRLRAGLLTLVGALAVHQGRYRLLPPEGHHHGDAHEYLSWLVPAVGAVLVVAFAEFGVRLVRRTGSSPQLPSPSRLWLAVTAAMLAIFGFQECLEAELAHGEVSIGQIVAAGGWVAGPLSVATGMVLTALLCGAAKVVERVLARCLRPLRRTPATTALRPLPVRSSRASILGRRLAGRAPPVAA